MSDNEELVESNLAASARNEAPKENSLLASRSEDEGFKEIPLLASSKRKSLELNGNDLVGPIHRENEKHDILRANDFIVPISNEHV